MAGTDLEQPPLLKPRIDVCMEDCDGKIGHWLLGTKICCWKPLVRAKSQGATVLQRKPGTGKGSWKPPTHRINGNLVRSQSTATLLSTPCLLPQDTTTLNQAHIWDLIASRKAATTTLSPSDQKYSPLAWTSLHLVTLSQAPPLPDPCGLTKVLFLNANRLQRVKPTTSLAPGESWGKGDLFYVEGHIGTVVQEKGSTHGGGLKAKKGTVGERLFGREDGKEHFAYVVTLPRASADTDHSIQMKLLLFLKSSRRCHKIFLMQKKKKKNF